MSISVIVPTHNRDRFIHETLTSIDLQTLTDDEMEVLVVDDGSTDGTTKIASQWTAACSRKRTQFIRLPSNKGKATACNVGILAASSPYILFIDDDCIPAPDCAESHLRHQESVAMPTGVLGAIHFPKEWVEQSNFVRYFESRYVGNRPWSSIKGGPDDLPPNLMAGMNVSYPRETLISAGLFDETIGRGQDTELAYRLWQQGVRFVFNPHAALTHVSPEMRSFDMWLGKYLKYYDTSFGKIRAQCPEFVETFGHWFLQSPHLGRESLDRTIIKIMLRSLCRRRLARWLLSYLNRTDQQVRHFYPRLYLYVIATLSLERIKEQEALSEAMQLEV